MFSLRLSPTNTRRPQMPGTQTMSKPAIPIKGPTCAERGARASARLPPPGPPTSVCRPPEQTRRVAPELLAPGCPEACGRPLEGARCLPSAGWGGARAVGRRSASAASPDAARRRPSGLRPSPPARPPRWAAARACRAAA
eukprot:scaffold108950_cov32-Tisochrysis_lutea.AAC.7